MKLTVKLASLKVRFENLFNGQKALETVANEVINQNIHFIKDSVIPPIEQAIAKRILISSNQIFERAPASEFFP